MGTFTQLKGGERHKPPETKNKSPWSPRNYTKPPSSPSTHT